MKGILEMRDVSVGYGKKTILRGVNLAVKEGELLILAGPNGSGKTTLLKTAAGLMPPLKGRVLINGKDPCRLKNRERAALSAFLFQERESPWPFTVRETVAQGRFARRGWFGAENRIDRENVEEALARAELLPLAENPITEISGGELQRVYIARSIAQGAAFLLLDEPENNLDPKYSYMILTLISSLVREGRGAVVSLHDMRLASRFAHRAALLSRGNGGSGSIAAIGAPGEVLKEDTLGAVFDLAPDLVRSMVL